jgi:Fic family protein
MTYLEKKKIGKEVYLYLVKNVRLNGNFKKFRIYIGKGKIDRKELQKLKLKYTGILDERIKIYLVSRDPLLKLLPIKQIKNLEKVKELYKKSYSSLPEEVRAKHYEDFLIRFTYDTNAIEGSTVTLNETKLILLDKITPPNRTLREVREIENHEKAFSYVFNYKNDISRQFILKIHRILTNSVLPDDRSGKFRKVQVIITGAEIIPPKPEFVEKEIEQLIKRYNKHKRKYHPIILASYFHTAFEGIHPFVDFNGRTGRLLLNFILMKRGYPVVDVKYRDRLKYYEALEEAQKSYLKHFVNLVVKYLKEELFRVK